MKVSKENQCEDCRADEDKFCAECWKIEFDNKDRSDFISKMSVKQLNDLYKKENRGFVFRAGKVVDTFCEKELEKRKGQHQTANLNIAQKNETYTKNIIKVEAEKSNQNFEDGQKLVGNFLANYFARYF